jgi:Cu-Zn family superoxide dismutase
MAVAVFAQEDIIGEVVATYEPKEEGTLIVAVFTLLPAGKHGFHIHKAGDLRGQGCKGACEHWHKGSPCDHGGRPRRSSSGGPGNQERHTGDLGNVEVRPGSAGAKFTYLLEGVKPSELWGRALIVHADEDDLGRGGHEDSKTTGHSGARIGCAIFGRVSCS